MSARPRPLIDRNGAMRREGFQRVGRAVGERGRVRISNDGRQRAVVVEEHGGLPSGDKDRDQAERFQCTRYLRHAFVARADRDLGQVGDDDVGAGA